MVGGNGERVTLALVAKHGDVWNGVCAPADFTRLNRVLDQRCEEIGRRDPGEVRRTVVVPRQHVGAAEEYVAAGAQHLIVAVGPPYDLDPVLTLQSAAAGSQQP